MKRTPLWDQTFEGILAYIAEVKPKPETARTLIHAGNKQTDILKTESEQEVWELFEAGLKALKADALSDECGNLVTASNAISLRNSNISKTLNITPVYGRHESRQDSDDHSQKPKTADDRLAFSQIEKLLQLAAHDLIESRRLLIDATNTARRRDLGIKETSSLQNVFKTAQKQDAGNPLVMGTDLHHEMALKLKEMVNAYRRVHADITDQINKVSPYAPKSDETIDPRILQQHKKKPGKPGGLII